LYKILHIILIPLLKAGQTLIIIYTNVFKSSSKVVTNKKIVVNKKLSFLLTTKIEH